MVEIDISTLSAIITAVSVVAASIFAAVQIRNFVKNRNADMIMRLYRDFGEKEFQQSLYKLKSMEIEKGSEDYVKKLDELEASTNAIGILVFFEGIGVLAHRKLADTDLIDELIGGSIRTTFEKLQPLIIGYRKQTKQPEFCHWFEQLYKRLKQKDTPSA